jgi:uroporphyrinogen III methyltransferase / synthase
LRPFRVRGSRAAAKSWWEMQAKVYLVGAGPGDPGLITVKGRRVLEAADAVLFDHLANDALLDLAPPYAERVYVGKKKSTHAFSQEEICDMLIERAQRGWNVVRLKGGDPFIFGRGGEEAEALADAGIPFEIVPGVTTPLGIAAYTGVPLTHREHTSAVTFVTGHAVDDIDWDRVGMSETLVIFMGLTTFPQIARELIARGRSADTPAMAVRWATRADQETLVGTLTTLPALIEERHMKPPATIVVGEVVRLREKLDWFERLPLFGQRIVVTRARGQAEALTSKLAALGADVIELPAIEILGPGEVSVPPAVLPPVSLTEAIARLQTYGWLIFTSANGVKFFIDALDRSGYDLRKLRAKICAIGPATRAAIEALHLKVDLMGEEYVAEGLLAAFADHDLAGARVLLPRAAIARDLVPTELSRRGATVDVVEAYRTVAPEGLAERARNIFTAPRKPDWVTFTSSSTVQNLVAALGSEALRGVKAASIGPITSGAARTAGIEVAVEAREYTVDGLIAVLLQYDRPPGLSKPRSGSAGL